MKKNLLAPVPDELKLAGYLKAAKAPSTKMTKLLMLAERTDEGIEDVLRAIYDREDSYLRGLLARNPKTPFDLMMKLAEDDDTVVRENLAGSAVVPVEALRVLARDNDPMVREYVASSERTPLDALLYMARFDDDHGIQRELARNLSSSPEVIELLLGNEYFDEISLITHSSASVASKRHVLLNSKPLFRDWFREAARNEFLEAANE